MSDRIDQLIRLAAKKDLTPPKGLEERTMRKIEQRVEEKNRTKFQKVFRPIVALLLLAAVCLAASSAVVRYWHDAKNLSSDYPNNKETEEKLQEFHMEIDRVEEEQDLGELPTYSKIKITPQTAVSDGFATFVVIKVEGINGFVIKDDIVLDDEYCGIASLHSEGKEASGSAEYCYLSERQENALYYTMSLWGTKISLGKELAIEIATNALVRADVDEDGLALLPDDSDDTSVIDPGAYRAKIYCKVSGEPRIRNFFVSSEFPYSVRISPLGIQFWDMSKYGSDKLLNVGNISVILKDGREIPITLRGVGISFDVGPGIEAVSIFDELISDTADIRYLVVDGEKYDLKKIEKQQKQK